MPGHDILEILGGQPSYVVVYLAIERLGDGEDDPVEASISKIQALTNLSPPTVVQARQALVKAGVIAEVPGLPGSYLVIKRFARLFGKKGGTEGTRGTRSSRVLRKRRERKTEEPGKLFRTTPEARREAVRRALQILGSPLLGRRLISQAMKELFGLVEHDDFTVDDALEVARYCRREYDQNNRFRPLINLPYIWSSRQFTSLLSAARTAQSLGKSYSTIDDPAERARWQADYERRLREKGLM
jgi:hypothetical protein